MSNDKDRVKRNRPRQPSLAAGLLFMLGGVVSLHGLIGAVDPLL